MQQSKPYRKKAVTPVVGVILMVGLTVILSGAVTAYVMEIQQNSNYEVPQTKFSIEQNGDRGSPGATVKISHYGGDTIEASNIEITTPNKAAIKNSFSTEIQAGDTAVIDISNSDPGKIKVVWESQEKSFILADEKLE